MHINGLIHRDIKPDNFVVCGTENDLLNNLIKVIDFGISKSYLKNGNHIQFQDGRKQVGTPRYCSLNTHLGIEPSRRDDLESIGHVLLYFLLEGRLPW